MKVHNFHQHHKLLQQHRLHQFTIYINNMPRSLSKKIENNIEKRKITTSKEKEERKENSTMFLILKEEINTTLL